MGKVALFPASTDTLSLLIPNLRKLDRDEILASNGADFDHTLRTAIRLSYQPGEAWSEDGRLLCMFGVVPASLMDDRGIIWMVGTDAVADHGLGITRHTRRYLDFCAQRYPRQYNYVDVRNTPSIFWLKRLGFTIDPPEPHGLAGLPFHRFHKGF